MALGARRADVLAFMLRQSLTLTAIGVGLGLIGAASMTRYLGRIQSASEFVRALYDRLLTRELLHERAFIEGRRGLLALIV